MFQNAHKKPEIRKVTVTVRKPTDSASKPPRHKSPLNSPKPTSSSKIKSPAPRPKHSSSNLHVPLRKLERPSPQPSRPHAPTKRKAQQVNLFDSSSDDEDSGRDGSSEPPLTAKRPKPSPALEDIEVPDREIYRVGPWTEKDEEKWPITHGADMTGVMNAGKFTYNPVFATEAGNIAEISLQYPSNCEPERFALVSPVERGEYAPLEDIIETINHICQNYLPESQSEAMLDDINGFERRLKRAIRDSSLKSFKTVIEEFNDIISKALLNGTIEGRLKEQHAISLSLVERITAQIYSRTISPSVNLLKQYENGTDNVYGELLPPFSHMIFRETRLRKDHVFVDLGSGVGNVVLQAALEIGCESWGIEQMANPSSLGQKQLTEFRARCKRWSIVPGDVHLLKGDFLASPEIDSALRRADVILINNQAFTPDLNNKIVMKLLDVKEGTRIVTLKSFVPDGWEIKMRNAEDPRNLLTVVKKEYYSKRVSWTDGGGTYFIATKDSSRLRKFMRKHG